MRVGPTGADPPLLWEATVALRAFRGSRSFHPAVAWSTQWSLALSLISRAAIQDGTITRSFRLANQAVEGAEMFVRLSPMCEENVDLTRT